MVAIPATPGEQKLLNTIYKRNKEIAEAQEQNRALQKNNTELVLRVRELEGQNKLLETAAYFAEMIIAEHSESNYGQMREWISKFEQLELDWPIKDSGALQDGKRLAKELDECRKQLD